MPKIYWKKFQVILGNIYKINSVQFCVKVVKSLRSISKNLKHSEEFGKYSRKYNVN